MKKLKQFWNSSQNGDKWTSKSTWYCKFIEILKKKIWKKLKNHLQIKVEPKGGVQPVGVADKTPSDLGSAGSIAKYYRSAENRWVFDVTVVCHSKMCRIPSANSWNFCEVQSICNKKCRENTFCENNDNVCCLIEDILKGKVYDWTLLWNQRKLWNLILFSFCLSNCKFFYLLVKTIRKCFLAKIVKKFV